MPYQVEVGGKADAQLAGLDTAMGASVERKIQWLAENAAGMVHRRLVGLREENGVCNRFAKASLPTNSVPAKQPSERANRK